MRGVASDIWHGPTDSWTAPAPLRRLAQSKKCEQNAALHILLLWR